MTAEPPTPGGALWVVGDVHGALAPLRALLRRAGLIGEDDRWTGGAAHLAFLGDYLDRGPDGLGVIRLVRALEAQAPQSGGAVTALLGNHEVMFLAARRFRAQDPTDALGFRHFWLENGGQETDAAGLSEPEQAWLETRPGLARASSWLLLHADTPFYRDLGRTLGAANSALAALLRSPDPALWGRLLTLFTDRFGFLPPSRAALDLLDTFGGARLVHGHTPVFLLHEEVLGTPGEGRPFPYLARRVLGVDSAMAYREGAGFLVRLDLEGLAEVVTLEG